MNATPDTAPRRKPFQFSLRTLMLVVLIYGGLWLLTLKWGGWQLAQSYGAIYSYHDVDFTDGGTAIQIRQRLKNAIFHSDAMRGRAICPAPFILLWKWEMAHWSDGSYTPGNESDIHFWFFGFHRTIKEGELPEFEH